MEILTTIKSSTGLIKNELNVWITFFGSLINFCYLKRILFLGIVSLHNFYFITLQLVLTFEFYPVFEIFFQF